MEPRNFQSIMGAYLGTVNFELDSALRSDKPFCSEFTVDLHYEKPCDNKKERHFHAHLRVTTKIDRIS